jgi:hypothetical protein
METQKGVIFTLISHDVWLFDRFYSFKMAIVAMETIISVWSRDLIVVDKSGIKSWLSFRIKETKDKRVA